MNQALRKISMVGLFLLVAPTSFAVESTAVDQPKGPSAALQAEQSGTISCEQLLTARYSFLEAMNLSEAPKQPYVRVHHRPSAIPGAHGVQVAVFPKGTYRPEYERALRDQGYFAIIQKNADDSDATQFQDFMFGPENVYWMQPVYLDKEFDRATLDPKKQKDVLEWFDHADPELRSWIMATAPKSKDRSTLNKRLQVVGQKYSFEIARLNLGDYERWNREVFQPEVARKRGGINAWPPTGKELLVQHHKEVEDESVQEAKRLVKGMYRLFAYDQSGNLVAGSLMTRMNVVNQLKQKEVRYTIGAAVYNQEARRDGMATAVLAQWLKLARQLGREVLASGEADRVYLSYGTDPNFYGPDVEPTLQEFKLSMGFQPTPRLGADGVSVPKYLVKVLDNQLAHIDDRTSEEKMDPQSRLPEFVFYAYGADGRLERRTIKPAR